MQMVGQQLLVIEPLNVNVKFKGFACNAPVGRIQL